MTGWLSAGRLRWLLVLVLAGIGLWQFGSDRETYWRPGVLAAEPPAQTQLMPQTLAAPGGFQLTTRADFTARVRILGIERYRFDSLAAVAPLDFAVGWGAMSDTAVLDRLRISQGARYYFWYAAHLPAPIDEISSHSANWHLIPANRAQRRTLSGLHVGDVVTLRGRLVDVTGPSGVARTSLTREDTGAGACEILYVEAVERHYQP